MSVIRGQASHLFGMPIRNGARRLLCRGLCPVVHSGKNSSQETAASPTEPSGQSRLRSLQFRFRKPTTRATGDGGRGYARRWLGDCIIRNARALRWRF